MLHWLEDKDPQEIIDLLVPLDLQIKEILADNINRRYLSLRDLADMRFGKNISLMQAWKSMVNDSQLFFVASIGRRLMDIFNDLGNDQRHLQKNRRGNRQRSDPFQRSRTIKERKQLTGQVKAS